LIHEASEFALPRRDVIVVWDFWRKKQLPSGNPTLFLENPWFSLMVFPAVYPIHQPRLITKGYIGPKSWCRCHQPPITNLNGPSWTSYPRRTSEVFSAFSLCVWNDGSSNGIPQNVTK
jgi:hypothetical protein